MNAFLKSLAKKATYLIAALVIIAAVIVCLIRFLTPILDGHRADFEKIASGFLQTPVTIQHVRVSWYHYQPVISLNEVTILDRTTKESVFKLKKVSLLISISKSLWQWQVVTNGLMASGAELNISESATGELTVKEFSSLPFNQQASKSETKFTDVMAVLSKEPYVILSDIDLYYKGVGKQNRFVTLYHLSLENTELEHKIVGKAILHQELPTAVELAVKWSGKIEDLAQIKAQAYLYVSGLSLAQWAKDFSLQDWQVKNGVVSAKIWANWEQGAFQKIQTTFKSFGLSLYSNSNKMVYNINRLSGNLGWKREGNQQIIAGDDLLIDLPNHLWPVTSFSVIATQDAKGVLLPSAVNIGYIDLADIQPLLFSLPALAAEPTMQMLSAMKISGALQNISLNFSNPWNDWKHLSLNANFSQLKLLPYKKIPGVTNLAGSLKWNGSQGEIKLNSMHSLFQYDAIFKNTITLDQLSGDVQIQNDHDNWLVNIASLNLLNKELSTNAKGTITFSPKASPVSDISANITLKQVKNVTHYLPLSIFDKDLTKWLQNAFLAGEVLSAHAVLRGVMTDFPFDNGKGEFSIAAKVNNVDFRFAPDWPLLRHVTGGLIFAGRKITIDIDSADTLGIPVSKVHGVIPYLGDKKPQILDVTTDVIQTDFAKALKYVHSSPLEKTIGKMFAGVELQGKIALKLGLNIPLKHPDTTKVKGELAVNDSVMNLAPWNLKLDHLNGNITFTENSTQAKNITAELFNKPLQFDLSTIQQAKNNSVIQASFTNNFSISDFENWLKYPFTKVIQGNAKVKGVINLSLSMPLEVHLQSDLVGATIENAEKYGKKADEARDFSADIFLQANQPMRVKLSYGQLLSAAVMLDRKQDQYNLIGMNLRFGSGAADWPASAGIYITGQLDTLDWDKIKSLTSPSSADKTVSAKQLKEIDLNVKRVNLGGQTLNQVNFQVYPDGNNWDIHVDSEEIKGQLTVPVNIKRQSLIVAKFEKINIHASQDKASLSLDVKSMPAIAISADNVRYNDIPIGKMIFNATPASSGMTIQRLRIMSPHIDLRAIGDWKQSGNHSVTHLQGGATSAHVSQLLNSFGLDVKNFVSSNGSINFNLSWSDAPYSPSLAKISGRASLVMGAGRIVDIGEENGAKMDIGRMLSIFSLQTIPRRLALDFSDVFQKGYSFDSLRGDFVIRDGELNTNNMRFEGPVAKVGINGRIGLENKDYDFILSVAAHVTSSIPVAATLLTGNPLIGLGALAVNTLLGSKMSGVTTNYYAVTGSWNNPVWKSIKSGERG